MYIYIIVYIKILWFQKTEKEKPHIMGFGMWLAMWLIPILSLVPNGPPSLWGGPKKKKKMEDKTAHDI